MTRSLGPLRHRAARLRAHVERCPECGREPEPVPAEGGYELRCPVHRETRGTMTGDERAVAKTQGVGVITQEQDLAARQAVAMLQASGPQWLKQATPPQVLAFARVATMLGLNVLAGEAYLIHGGFYISVQGRRRFAVMTGEWEGTTAPREMSPDEMRTHGVREGDIGRVVEVYRSGTRVPAYGVGIVRAGEIETARKAGANKSSGVYFVPLAERPEFMAGKRAEVAALRQAFPDLHEAVRQAARAYAIEITEEVTPEVEQQEIEGPQVEESPSEAEEPEVVEGEQGLF